ncbi:MAG: hypothetical protein SFZ23_00380 [Planctomycetota bacterium]|nr:hypothetical protein [Planctomycetota bacterium]
MTSTYKTLTEVEPRTLVSAATTPGNATAMFVISQPGSYYLGGNVNATGGRHGIVIAADNVTLDLNGYTIDGAGSPGFPSGITSNNTNRRALMVRNGNINNFAGYGIFAQTRDSAFESLGFSGNRSGGLELFQSNNCIAREVRITMPSGEAGLQLSSNARVENCIVDGGFNGIIVGANSVVTGSVAVNQPGSGIVSGGGIVDTCSVYSTNGTTSFNAAGISTGPGVTVRNCSVRDVRSAGIFIGGDGRIEGCRITQCNRGIASSQFSSGRTVIQDNDISDSGTMAIDLPSGKHLVLGNRLRGNAGAINANPSVVLGEVVLCGPGALPASASNPTVNLVW